jgi:hypothetical protein
MQKLILARNDLHAAAGAAIAAAPWAPGLVHLDVSSNEMFGDGGLRALADSTQLTSLRTLILEFTGLYDAAVEIFKAPLFQQLERIDISATGVDIEAVRPFLGERVVWKRGV